MTVESYYVIAIATLSYWLKRLAPIFQPMRIKTKTNGTMYAWFFPALRASYRWLLGILIGSWSCLFLLWLVGVIALVLVFRQSFENRSNRCLGRPHYKELQWCSLELMNARTKTWEVSSLKYFLILAMFHVWWQETLGHDKQSHQIWMVFVPHVSARHLLSSLEIFVPRDRSAAKGPLHTGCRYGPLTKAVSEEWKFLYADWDASSWCCDICELHGNRLFNKLWYYF